MDIDGLDSLDVDDLLHRVDALEDSVARLETALSELRKEQEEERERMGRELVGGLGDRNQG